MAPWCVFCGLAHACPPHKQCTCECCGRRLTRLQLRQRRRQPGADIGAYFNYGLGEKGWKDYAEAVRKARFEAWHKEHTIATVDGGGAGGGAARRGGGAAALGSVVIDADMPEEIRRALMEARGASRCTAALLTRIV